MYKRIQGVLRQSGEDVNGNRVDVILLALWQRTTTQSRGGISWSRTWLSTGKQFGHECIGSPLGAIYRDTIRDYRSLKRVVSSSLQQLKLDARTSLSDHLCMHTLGRRWPVPRRHRSTGQGTTSQTTSSAPASFYLYSDTSQTLRPPRALPIHFDKR